ncbi:hypothetical protein D3C78_1303250 [compost metagenome]
MVAAWISAETGVGPAIASGNQVNKGNCALLPIAPTKSNKVIVVNTVTLAPSAFGKISAKLVLPNVENSMNIPKRKPKSPIRFITNAFLAALAYSVFLNQKPINKYEHKPTPSQPINMIT